MAMAMAPMQCNDISYTLWPLSLFYSAVSAPICTVPHDRDAALVVVPPAVAPVVVAVAGPAAHVGHPHIESPVTVTFSHM